MSTPPERVAVRFHEDAGFLSSNLAAGDTGVEGAVIWVFAGEPSRTESQDGSRILVALGDTLTLDGLADSVAVRLTIPPDVLGTLPREVARQALEFAAGNRAVLLEYWQGNGYLGSHRAARTCLSQQTASIDGWPRWRQIP